MVDIEGSRTGWERLFGQPPEIITSVVFAAGGEVIPWRSQRVTAARVGRLRTRRS